MIEAQTPAFRLVYAFENASQITCTRLHYKCNNKHDSVVPAVDTGIHAVRVPTTGMRASEQVEQFKLAPLSGCPVSHHEDCRHVLGRLVPFPPLSAPLRHTCKITKIFEICVCAVCAPLRRVFGFDLTERNIRTWPHMLMWQGCAC